MCRWAWNGVSDHYSGADHHPVTPTVSARDSRGNRSERSASVQMLSCLVPRFGSEDKQIMPSSSPTFTLQQCKCTQRNDDGSGWHLRHLKRRRACSLSAVVSCPSGCAVKCPRQQQWLLFQFPCGWIRLFCTSTNQQKMEQKNSIEMFICYSTPPFVGVPQVDPFLPPSALFLRWSWHN